MAEFHICDDAEAVAARAAAAVTRAAAAAIGARGVFHWALAGGTTPKRCYELLRDADIDWSRVHIWFGDERCLPPADAQRNDSMAGQALLKHVPLPAAQLHRIAAELGPEIAAASYCAELAQVARMDLVLLGLGEDGHTASLFPDHPALLVQHLAVPVFNAPKPPPERVSMGLPALQRARACLILAVGAGKADAVARIRAGEMLPAGRIASAVWLLDRQAAAESPGCGAER